jgi:hypothetical protein
MSTDQPPVWVRAFIGRSFLSDDEELWNGIRKLLESLRPAGLEFEDAAQAEPRRISKKITEKIDRNDTYIGILTRRFPVYSGAPTEIETKMKSHISPDEWARPRGLSKSAGTLWVRTKELF